MAASTIFLLSKFLIKCDKFARCIPKFLDQKFIFGAFSIFSKKGQNFNNLMFDWTLIYRKNMDNNIELYNFLVFNERLVNQIKILNHKQNFFVVIFCDERSQINNFKSNLAIFSLNFRSFMLLLIKSNISTWFHIPYHASRSI